MARSIQGEDNSEPNRYWLNTVLFLLLTCSFNSNIFSRNLFKKETNIQSFVSLKVSLSTGETGVIEGSFGQSGKFKVGLDSKYLSGLNYIVCVPDGSYC